MKTQRQAVIRGTSGKSPRSLRQSLRHAVLSNFQLRATERKAREEKQESIKAEQAGRKLFQDIRRIPD